MTNLEFKEIRKKNKISAVSLAKMLGVTRQTIHSYESGKIKIKKQVEKLFGILVPNENNHNTEHTKAVNAVLLALGLRDDLKVIKRDVGCARAINNPKQIIKFGRKGEADIEVVLAPRGRVLYLEVKTGSGTQNVDQINFSNYMKKVGAQYHVIHTVEEALEIVKNAER